MLFANLLNYFNNNHLQVCLGIELEFFVLTSDEGIFDQIASFLYNELGNHVTLKRESIDNQFEIVFKASNNIINVCNTVKRCRDILRNFFLIHNIEYYFSQFKDVSNGMHINISIVSLNSNQNMLIDDSFLGKCIGGLLFLLDKGLFFFVNLDGDFMSRFSSKSISCPSNISWGIDNRSCAIRVVKKHQECPRIENRVPSADSGIFAAVFGTLLGIKIGIDRSLGIPKPIYGVASHDQYTQYPHYIKKITSEIDLDFFLNLIL